jgi:hypothetical protein
MLVPTAMPRWTLAAGENWRGLAGRVALAEAISAAAMGNCEVAEHAFDQALAMFERWALPWSQADAPSPWGRAIAAAGRGHLATVPGPIVRPVTGALVRAKVTTMFTRTERSTGHCTARGNSLLRKLLLADRETDGVARWRGHYASWST